MNAQPTPTLPPSPGHADNKATRPLVASVQILRGNRTADIVHDGQRYLLRVTRENKLILTK
ncbi:MAG: hemin uptake protein HemP [Betaproteobacteria bacterium]|nr:hemin uptake protein HemP [Betaproteobacteria bacterium]